jgi:hypothetical protein
MADNCERLSQSMDGCVLPTDFLLRSKLDRTPELQPLYIRNDHPRLATVRLSPGTPGAGGLFRGRLHERRHSREQPILATLARAATSSTLSRLGRRCLRQCGEQMFDARAHCVYGRHFGRRARVSAALDRFGFGQRGPTSYICTRSLLLPHR